MAVLHQLTYNGSVLFKSTMADRDKRKDVIHYGDRGMMAFVGATDDSYDDALAETVNPPN